jgi:hypothetical protein
VDLDRLVVFGGATWQIAERLDVGREVYAAPADAVTARITVRTAVGGSSWTCLTKVGDAR